MNICEISLDSEEFCLEILDQSNCLDLAGALTAFAVASLARIQSESSSAEEVEANCVEYIEFIGSKLSEVWRMRGELQ